MSQLKRTTIIALIILSAFTYSAYKLRLNNLYQTLSDDTRCIDTINAAYPDYPIVELQRVITFSELDEDIKETLRHFSSPPLYLRYYTAYKEVNGEKDTLHFVYGIIKDNGTVILWGRDSAMG
jgi:hypothetical protein